MVKCGREDMVQFVREVNRKNRKVLSCFGHDPIRAAGG
jgi:hypothetical protein